MMLFVVFRLFSSFHFSEAQKIKFAKKRRKRVRSCSSLRGPSKMYVNVFKVLRSGRIEVELFRSRSEHRSGRAKLDRQQQLYIRIYLTSFRFNQAINNFIIPKQHIRTENLYVEINLWREFISLKITLSPGHVEEWVMLSKHLSLSATTYLMRSFQRQSDSASSSKETGWWRALQGRDSMRRSKHFCSK